MKIGPRLGAAAAIVILLGVGPSAQVLGETDRLASTLKPATSFASIADPRARSIALFREAGKVLTHPRCVNCHSGGNKPLQGDRMRPHRPLVVGGGPRGAGAPGLPCVSCHGKANYDPARVPSAPHWALAPPIIGWRGKTLGAICRQVRDPKRNGGRDMAAIISHMTKDGLIKWAWNPGRGRTPAPGSHARFVRLIEAWAATGAHCPPS